MPPKKPSPSANRAAAPSKALESFLAALDHPLKAEIHALREIIASMGPTVREDIKWNAPSFHTSEHFATFNFRSKDGLQLVLHLGTKPRPDAALRTAIADPDGILDWRAADRALVTFRDLSEVKAKEQALRRVLQQWIAFV
jgi:hypothetical protein